MIKIAIDTSPLKETSHRIRGVGRYLNDLIEALLKHDQINTYLTSGQVADFEKADVVHYPYFHPYQITLPRIFPKPTVVTVHDLVPLVFPQVYRPGLKGKGWFLVQKRRLRRASVVVTDSEASTRDVQRFYRLGPDRVKTVYLAPNEKFEVIGRSSFRLNKVRQKYQLPEKFVLYVGDVNYNKNLPRLVQACWQIQIPLIIVGKQAAVEDFDRRHPENREWAWLREQVEKKVALSSGEALIWPLGYVSDEDLVGLYNLAGCYCQPSRYEGFGLSVLEAMSCGTPVVATANSSLLEIVDSAGILVKEEGVDSLATALNEVISNKGLQKKMAVRGLAQAARFSWKKTALMMKEVYEKAVEK